MAIQIYDHSVHCILIQDEGVGYLINKDSCTVSSNGNTIMVSWHDWEEANPVRYKGIEFESVTVPLTADVAALVSAINGYLATGGGGAASYLVYTALLSQSGTSDPVPADDNTVRFQWYQPVLDGSGTPFTNTPIKIEVYP